MESNSKPTLPCLHFAPSLVLQSQTCPMVPAFGAHTFGPRAYVAYSSGHLAMPGELVQCQISIPAFLGEIDFK